MNSSVTECNGEKSLQVGETELGCLTDSKKPHGYKVSDSSSHLEGSDGPWKGQNIQCLLVVDIVSDVE